MCFTPKISGTLTLFGAIMTAIAYTVPAYRAEYFYIITGFYTLMELLQTVQYLYVNQCDNPMNKFLTEIAYILVIVQPLLWNFIFYLRATREEDKRIFKVAMVLFSIWMIGNIYSRFGYNSAREREFTRCGFMYGDKTCTYRKTDSSHLYWKWKTRHFPELNANYFMYIVLWFVPALFAKETWITSVYLMASLLIGFLLTMKYSATIFEFPSVWCYISLPVIIIGFFQIYFTKIRGAAPAPAPAPLFK